LVINRLITNLDSRLHGNDNNETRYMEHQFAKCPFASCSGVVEDIPGRRALPARIKGYADEQKRVIAATIDGVRVVNVYIVNGQSLDSEKYQYKMAWLTALRGYMANAIAEFGDVALLGDYNIAPEDRDVHDPKAWEGQVLVSVPERKHFEALIALGLVDSFRLFKQAEKSFTWWDYRMNGFKRNLGLRIDHILLTKNLAAETKGSVIDVEPRKLERPSDHTPVISTIRA